MDGELSIQVLQANYVQATEMAGRTEFRVQCTLGSQCIRTALASGNPVKFQETLSLYVNFWIMGRKTH